MHNAAASCLRFALRAPYPTAAASEKTAIKGAGPLQKTGGGPTRDRKAADCKNNPAKNRTRTAKNGPSSGTAQKTANPAATAKTGVNKGESSRLAGMDMGIRQESYHTVSGAAQA